MKNLLKTGKLFIIILAILVITSAIGTNISAATSYTLSQVAKHNSIDDCYMVINNNIYDLTDYLLEHDQKLNIRSWCGKEATNDYDSKAGRGESHSNQADLLLSQYLIGTLDTQKQLDSTPSKAPSNSTKNVGIPKAGSDKYHTLIFLLGTITIYLLSLKVFKKQTHNFIWNSVMLLGLVPSFGFGMIMALAKQYSWFGKFIDSDMLLHHVQFSTVFGTACVLHFIIRLKIYLSQGKSLKIH